MQEPTPPLLPPPEFQPPGEEPYVHAPSLLPMSMLLPPPITIAQYSGAMGGMGMGYSMGMGMSPGFGYGAPMVIPASMLEPARTTPYNQYTIRTSFVTLNIPPKNATSSSLVGGLLRKDASSTANASVVPSETASWAYDPSGSPDSETNDDGDGTVDPLPLAAAAARMATAKGGKGGYPRPKTNIRSTNSTFVTRVQSHDGFTKIVPQPPHLENASPAHFPPTRWAFTNTGRMLVWTLVDPSNKIKDPILRVFFNNYPTCHVFCEGTKSAPGTAEGGRLDMVLGFNTGDLFWLDPITLKYTRLNKAGIIHGRLVISIRFHPLNPTLIYALFSDGLVMVLSTEREDPDFKLTIGQPPWAARLKTWENGRRRSPSDAAPPPNGTNSGEDNNRHQQPVFVWRNEEPAPLKNQQPPGSPYAGKNPVAVWKTGMKPVKAFEFSPDGQAIALVAEDGTMRIVDAASLALLDTYEGYFGGLTCLAWSPDGRYVVTGGQDDLVTIISPRESRVVARGQGHASYVTSIAFDRRRSNARAYRFGSVGEDGRVLFWDFSAAELQRPRHIPTSVHVASTDSLEHVNGDAAEGEEARSTYHPAPSLGDVAMIQPVMSKLMETVVINQLTFLPDSVVTVSKVGNIRFYMRGKAPAAAATVDGATNGMRGLKVTSSK
ncbi:hypothetical protein QFC22_000653 [Naganishia vaughanmartiniae]|uniref:Uncharacterized protein n=1 Tax=Naganishia vaughanmartiniae TaxID=1424756 RepID=A0ACC2XPY8_9TREE|nr:hypothetical protein QFC22_000653 [Naganishia vaughanmartiniae]